MKVKIDTLEQYAMGFLVAAGLLATATLTGCSGVIAGNSGKEGYVLLHADEKGMRALGDWQNGMVSEVRTPKGQKSSGMQLRELQTIEQSRQHQATMERPNVLQSIIWGGLANKKQ